MKSLEVIKKELIPFYETFSQLDFLKTSWFEAGLSFDHKEAGAVLYLIYNQTEEQYDLYSNAVDKEINVFTVKNRLTSLIEVMNLFNMYNHKVAENPIFVFANQSEVEFEYIYGNERKLKVVSKASKA